MEVCLSSPLGVDCHQLSKEAGITCWDAQSPAITQIETIGSLQSKTIRGTGTVLLQEYPSAEQLVEWLQKAWKQDITRMQFIHAPMEVGQIFHLPS